MSFADNRKYRKLEKKRLKNKKKSLLIGSKQPVILAWEKFNFNDLEIEWGEDENGHYFLRFWFGSDR
jgi:hypothetical protein